MMKQPMTKLSFGSSFNGEYEKGASAPFFVFYRN